MSELLKVEGLSTSLHNGARIVDDISFSIKQGETFALLGESGCGKSMTALSLMRLLPDGIHIASGAVLLGAEDILALPERAMRAVRGGQMAMIFQEPGLSLNPVMTVGGQIAEALELHQDLRGEAMRARCVELLEQVGIPDAPRRLHEYPFQLSGGMKQRVMIAMALAGQPGLLIAAVAAPVPGWSRPARWSARLRSAGRARRPAPARSSRAASCRRKAGTGIR